MIKNVILIAGCSISVIVAAYSVSEYVKQHNKTVQARKRLEAVKKEVIKADAIRTAERMLEEEKKKGDIEDDIRKLLRKVDRTLEMG